MRQLRFWYASQPLTNRSISRSGVSIVTADSVWRQNVLDFVERPLHLFGSAILVDQFRGRVAVWPPRPARNVHSIASPGGISNGTCQRCARVESTARALFEPSSCVTMAAGAARSPQRPRNAARSQE